MWHVKKGANLTVPKVTASDNIDGNISDKISVTVKKGSKSYPDIAKNIKDNKKVKFPSNGTYTVTYTVKDSSGNKISKVRKVEAMTKIPYGTTYISEPGTFDDYESFENDLQYWQCNRVVYEWVEYIVDDVDEGYWSMAWYGNGENAKEWKKYAVKAYPEPNRKGNYNGEKTKEVSVKVYLGK